jgi:hypothetical protein
VLRGRREGAVELRERHQIEPAAVAVPTAPESEIAFTTPPHEWA